MGDNGSTDAWVTISIRRGRKLSLWLQARKENRTSPGNALDHVLETGQRVRDVSVEDFIKKARAMGATDDELLAARLVTTQELKMEAAV